ncbi:cell division cycle protein 23 homolog [Orbicella faveolata]|uniref:cell division cycle protein 23 homolog n=1 Tax=Orbicella faveolata TaxID=48498 RepID=UPI0009E55C81|nr:cell division cycle protein 23 homolog [Orbicella faveolata]
MAAVSNVCLPEIKRDLLHAVKECSERGLLHSAKWSAELAFSIPSFPSSDHLPKTDYYDPQFVKDFDRYTLGKTFFDLKEFDRAAFFLDGCTSHKAYFLYMYSRYLAGEKHKNDKMMDVLGPQENVQNQALTSLRAELYKKHRELDGFCLYLYGVVLKKLDLREDALEVIQEAVTKEPLHWGAWLELSSLCSDKEVLQSLTLPSHWMAQFFQANVAIDLQLNEEGLERYANLSQAGFSENKYILLQTALVQYHARDFDAACELFKEVQKRDPYSLEHMDTYSNILYVKEMKPELSYLAHHTNSIDKYREETCCVIGNYYSLHDQHEKAVTYFQRALKLNPHYTSAWTLMGHEFMERKNTSAAIEAYRKAIEVNYRDYRAWYGLGQTYEILKMPFYCLYYYRQAHKFRPNDSRMLVALGESYEKLDNMQHAKKCYFRAMSVGDLEGMAVIKLARLHEQLQEDDDAAIQYNRYVEQTEVVGILSVADLCSAYLFLAKYNLKKRNLEAAEMYAHKCCEFNEGREEGKGLLRQISNSRSIGESERESSDAYTQELSLGNITADHEAVMSPVAPTNLDFNTP